MLLFSESLYHIVERLVDSRGVDLGAAVGAGSSTLHAAGAEGMSAGKEQSRYTAGPARHELLTELARVRVQLRGEVVVHALNQRLGNDGIAATARTSATGSTDDTLQLYPSENLGLSSLFS